MKCSVVVGRRGGSASPSNFRPSTPAPDRARFPRARHLARAGEIRRVAREGKRIRTAHCDVRVNASLLHLGRVGIVVPKHGHRIVDRNRLRRRLSELVRTELLAHIGRTDLLIRALPEAYRASFDALRDDVRTLRRRFAPKESMG